MSKSPFTEKEINDIIRKPKYIDKTFLNYSPNVKNKEKVYLQTGEDCGLMFITQPCEGTIGTSLTWRNIRIRGINSKRRHRRCDGKVIKGWHEHIWKKKCGERWVEPLEDELFGKFPDPQEVIKYSLDKWNITPRGAIGIQLSNLFKIRENK